MVKVVYVPHKIGNGKKNRPKQNGYIGMNSEAYKSIFRKKYPYSKDTILIYDKIPKEQEKRTLLHEVAELEMMKDSEKNWGYKKSHQAANAIENSPDLIVKIKGSSRARGHIRSML